jgi:hypothetical protein
VAPTVTEKVAPTGAENQASSPVPAAPDTPRNMIATTPAQRKWRTCKAGATAAPSPGNMNNVAADALQQSGNLNIRHRSKLTLENLMFNPNTHSCDHT